MDENEVFFPANMENILRQKVHNNVSVRLWAFVIKTKLLNTYLYRWDTFNLLSYLNFVIHKIKFSSYLEKMIQ